MCHHTKQLWILWFRYWYWVNIKQRIVCSQCIISRIKLSFQLIVYTWIYFYKNTLLSKSSWAINFHHISNNFLNVKFMIYEKLSKYSKILNPWRVGPVAKLLAFIVHYTVLWFKTPLHSYRELGNKKVLYNGLDFI